jgi:predicted DNA-binding transcriptional regulator YafY
VNRTDRLYAIHEELRRRHDACVTAAQLAELLEVSIRTIKRDVSAMQQSGAPIWSQAGPGGGYALVGAVNLPALNFTAAQAVAAAVALAVLPEGSPFSVDARTASRKLTDALSAIESSLAEDLASRVWVNPGHAGGKPAKPTVLRAVEISMATRFALSIAYQSTSGAVNRRVIEPAILAWTNDRWYLVAHCQLRDDLRWFDLARIDRADLTRQPYEPRDVADIGAPPPTAARLQVQR